MINYSSHHGVENWNDKSLEDLSNFIQDDIRAIISNHGGITTEFVEAELVSDLSQVVVNRITEWKKNIIFLCVVES
jgi:hypothetical protein